MAEQLKTADAERRAAEIEKDLSQGKLPEHLPALRQYLFHPCTELRQVAVRALGRAGDAESVGDMIRLLVAGLDPFDHDDIYDAIRTIGAPAVPALAQLVRLGPRAERSGALVSLALMGPVAVPALVEFLPLYPALTLKALVNCSDSRLVPPLLEELQRKRTSQALVLERLAECCDHSCQSAVPLLLEILPQISGTAAANALLALGKIEDPRALPVILEALDGKHALAAAQALCAMTGPESLLALRQASERDFDVEVMDQLLEGALQHPLNDFEGRRRIALKIAGNPQAFENAHDALGECVDLARLRQACPLTGSPEQALKLAATLGRGRSAWQCASRDQDPKVRRLAAQLHSWVDDAGPFEHLLADSHWRVREAMTQSIWEPKHAGLQKQMLKDPHPAVRLAAVNNLDVGPKLPSILVGLAADPSPRVRRAAAQLARFLQSNLTKKAWTKLMTSILTTPEGEAIDVKLENGETVRSVLELPP